MERSTRDHGSRNMAEIHHLRVRQCHSAIILYKAYIIVTFFLKPQSSVFCHPRLTAAFETLPKGESSTTVPADRKCHSLLAFSDAQAVPLASLRESEIKLVAGQWATVTIHPRRREIVPIQRLSSSHSIFKE